MHHALERYRHGSSSWSRPQRCELPSRQPLRRTPSRTPRHVPTTMIWSCLGPSLASAWRKRRCISPSPTTAAATSLWGSTAPGGLPRLSIASAGRFRTCGWRRVQRGLGLSGSGSQTMQRSLGCWRCPPQSNSSPTSASVFPRHSGCSPNEKEETSGLGDVSIRVSTQTSGDGQAKVLRRPCPQLMGTRHAAKSDHVWQGRCPPMTTRVLGLSTRADPTPGTGGGVVRPAISR
jgi:hypothetical protein